MSPAGRKPFSDAHGDSETVIAYDGYNSKVDIHGNDIPHPDMILID